jgi:hypothetical protein
MIKLLLLVNNKNYKKMYINLLHVQNDNEYTTREMIYIESTYVHRHQLAGDILHEYCIAPERISILTRGAVMRTNTPKPSIAREWK